MTCFVAHRGEEVVAIGTIEEVALALGVKKKIVSYLTSPTNHRKWAQVPNSRRVVVDRVEV